MAVQREADERWKKRMGNEDKITTNTIEVLRSKVNRMSEKMAEEVVYMNRHQESAASTVSWSTGSGGRPGNFAARAVQNTFVASRIELKGWGCWRNIRGTGITLEETKELVSMAKTRLKQDDLGMFDWDLIVIKGILTSLHGSQKGSVRPSARSKARM